MMHIVDRPDGPGVARTLCGLDLSRIRWIATWATNAQGEPGTCPDCLTIRKRRT